MSDSADSRASIFDEPNDRSSAGDDADGISPEPEDSRPSESDDAGAAPDEGAGFGPVGASFSPVESGATDAGESAVPSSSGSKAGRTPVDDDRSDEPAHQEEGDESASTFGQDPEQQSERHPRSDAVKDPNDISEPASGAFESSTSAPQPHERAYTPGPRPSSRAPRSAGGRRSSTGPSVRALARGLLAASLLAVATLWTLSRISGESSQGDLLGLAPRSRDGLTTLLEARDNEQLAFMVQQQVGWRILVPEIENARPAGLGFSEVQTGISLPILVYRTPTEGDVFIALLNYAFLDTHEGLLRLDREVLLALQDERTFVLPGSQPDILVWRSGDEIFVAVVPTDRNGWTRRITP